MAIFRGSRYEGVDITAIVDESGLKRTLLHNRKRLTQDDIGEHFMIHAVAEGETLDSLAHKYGGSETLWWIIADVNNLDFPFDLLLGSKLIIPSASFFAEYHG